MEHYKGLHLWVVFYRTPEGAIIMVAFYRTLEGTHGGGGGHISYISGQSQKRQGIGTTMGLLIWPWSARKDCNATKIWGKTTPRNTAKLAAAAAMLGHRIATASGRWVGPKGPDPPFGTRLVYNCRAWQVKSLLWHLKSVPDRFFASRTARR